MGMNSHSSPFQFLNTCHFSYFTELQDRHWLIIMVETLILLSIFLASVVGNVYAMVRVFRRKRMVNHIFFTLNLFVADLLFTSMIPFVIAARWTTGWWLGSATCRMMFYVLCMSGCVVIVTLAAISLDRVLAILKLRTMQPFNSRVASGTVALIWIVSAIAMMPMCLFFKVTGIMSPQQEVIEICTLIFPNIAIEFLWNITFTCFGFVIPGTVIVVSYSRILQIRKSSLRRIQRRSNTSNRATQPISRHDYLLFRTLLILMVSFFLTWGPMFIIDILLLSQNFHINISVSPCLFFWVFTFTLANSVLNPVLYCLCQFRRSWHRMCCATEVSPLKRPPDCNEQRTGSPSPEISIVCQKGDLD
ncbi:free fatty acid receptor 4-like [Chanos chanos]|uniref:Free fatty acid receptor 4-like n=1 Tax=Chanos chanos TaxID=29144 RepID=A0A6J2V566_CHACN|nr:free fatty acid receptor 4 [Chanos chanos]